MRQRKAKKAAKKPFKLVRAVILSEHATEKGALAALKKQPPSLHYDKTFVARIGETN